MNDSSADVQTLLKILKQMVFKNDITLDDFEFRTINREEIENTISEW